MKLNPVAAVIVFVLLTALGGVFSGAFSGSPVYAYIMGVIVSAAVIGLMAEMNKAGSRGNPPVV